MAHGPNPLKRIDAAVAKFRFDCGPEDCWDWPGAKSKGRGRVFISGKPVFVYRVLWERENGPVPDGKFLCHHCDNPACVRPSHIYAGTYADNISDCVRRGRHLSQTNPEKWRQICRKSGLMQREMSAEQVREIRLSSESNTELARRFGVHRVTIQGIRNRRRYAEVA